MPHALRKATLSDRADLESLISRSARALGAADYTPEQIEGALRGAFGVDTRLIADGTYFVVESNGTIIGCGGWSRRRTPFGGDAGADRDDTELDPKTDAAKIRAFFVAPEHARQGIGRALLERCEAEARAEGFSRFELTATLPGMRLYRACGYAPQSSIHYEVGARLAIEFVPMSKEDLGCKHDAGKFRPLIDRNRCEGKEACVGVCPYQVFTMSKLPSAERRGLTLLGKMKGFAHRWRQSFATNAEACHACGLCVTACPEKAITLVRVR